MWEPIRIMQPTTKDAYKLLHDGVQALSRVEHAGLMIDVDYLKRTIAETDQRINDLLDEMRTSDTGRYWSRKYGTKTNMGSGSQFSAVLRELGHKLPRTKATAHLGDNDKGIRYSTDIGAIEQVADPFVKLYLECEKLKKVNGTFLAGIRRECIDGKVHVNFNLHTTVTYRSSSSNFNFQNLPIRDPVQGAIVRKCFVPRPGRRLVEIDYSGIEVCIAACYHKDPNMLVYITDKSKDMHRDMAAQCYNCKPEQVSKQMRYAGKNMFVFPEFYGSFWRDCALNLWNYIGRQDLKTVDGTSALKHLKRVKADHCGSCKSHYDDGPVTYLLTDPWPPRKERGRIEALDGFAKHIHKVELDFWGNRFAVYNRWKRQWFDDYRKLGYFKTLTGFVVEGYFARNDVINYPVQGSAFHCLLRSLILIQKQLRKRKMKTLIVGQIHDSIVADVPDNELDDYLEIAHHTMTVTVPNEWREWIIVPLEVEAEVTPLNATWHDKEAYSYG